MRWHSARELLGDKLRGKAGRFEDLLFFSPLILRKKNTSEKGIRKIEKHQRSFRFIDFILLDCLLDHPNISMTQGDD